MAIYWRNGRAWGRKTIKGVEYREALGTTSKREAEAAYNRWVTSLDEAKGGSKKETTFAEAVDLFNEHHMPRLRKSSQVRYLQSLLLLTEKFEKRTLQSITRSDLSSFVSDRKKSGVKDASVLRDLACLSSVFTVAADWERADANPVQSYIRSQKKRKLLTEADARSRHLSHAEELEILSYAIALAMAPTSIRKAEKWMIARALSLYIDTGMRAQELLMMRWAWINLAMLEITVPGDMTKSGKDRVIPILPRAAKVLQRIPRNEHTDLVFWRTHSGRRFDDLNHTFQRYAEKSGVRDVHIHDLRRTCGCRLLQDHRMPMAGVSKWLGHSSIVMTERAYAFLTVQNLHDAVGTARVRENLKPKLAAVMDSDILQIGSKHGTMSGTLDLKAIEMKGEIVIKAVTHNP